MRGLWGFLYLLNRRLERKEQIKLAEEKRQHQEYVQHQKRLAKVRRQNAEDFHKRVVTQWKRQVCDPQLERKVRLYLLDEKNKPEYEPWLQKIFATFKHGESLVVRRMSLTRSSNNPADIYENPLDIIYGAPITVNYRDIATSIIMAEFGKICEHYATDVAFRMDGTQEYMHDVVRYLAEKISQHHPKDSIRYRLYGAPWQRLGLLSFPGYYWILNDTLIYNHLNPDDEYQIIRTLEKIGDNPPMDIDPEDVEFIKKELHRIRYGE